MQSSAKITYLAAIGVEIACSIIGAFLTLNHQMETGIAFLGIALVFIPIIGHLRMRRQFSALRSFFNRTNSISATELDRHVQQIEETLESTQELLTALNESQSRQEGVTRDTTKELRELSHNAIALRREARVARLMNETIRQELSR